MVTMQARHTIALFVILVAMMGMCAARSTAQSNSPQITYSVKTDATELDAMVLIQKLNENGKSNGVSFVRVESGYAYLIKFETFQGTQSVTFRGSGGDLNTSNAGAKVFDPKGLELFEFVRAGRGTDKAATNSVAKEIIKRIEEYTRLLAEQGYADAQFNFGLRYANGQGMIRDYVQAAIWYRMAAEQGYADAQFNLGTLYANGKGVKRDYAEAYFWSDLAAAGKLHTWKQEDAVKARDEAASHLTPADLTQVQERARKWFEEHAAKANPQ
jgi:hypothetical protein